MDIKKIKAGDLHTNCYILFDNGEAVVVDPGGSAKEILAELKKIKLLYIINTHYHFDHVLANGIVKKETGAQILIHANEKEFIDFSADKFLQDGDEIKFGQEKLKVIHTPGHTAGGICLLGDNVIFTGDTLFKGTYGYTAFPGGSEADMQKSLAKLKVIIKSGMHVYPGHGQDYMN